jgi:hypothetical protein
MFTYHNAYTEVDAAVTSDSATRLGLSPSSVTDLSSYFVPVLSSISTRRRSYSVSRKLSP